MTLMNRAQYAEHCKVVPTAVTKWKDWLVKVEDPDRQGKFLIDVEASDAARRARVDTTTGRPRKDDGPVGEQLAQATTAVLPGIGIPAKMSLMEEARLEHLRERTMRQQLDRAALVGQLLPLEEYTTRASDMGRMIRERAHALVRQHSERLAAETEPRKIVAILADALDLMFNQVAEDLDRQADDEQRADAVLADVEAADQAQTELELDDPT